MFYIVQGTVVQHRSDMPARALKQGDISVEDNGVEHWWENKGKVKVVLIVADILNTAKKGGESM